MTDLKDSIPTRRAGFPSALLERIARHANAITVTAIAAAFAFKLLLIFRINISWDEFYFLSFVHDFARGELTGRFQTFHVHLFSWLPFLDGEISQIIAGRLAMALAAMASAALVYGIARRVSPRGAALFATLGYVSLSVVIEHGSSFRTDPIATVLVLLALFWVVRNPGSVTTAALAGAVLALAALVTIKVAFFVPVFAGVVWCLLPGLRQQARIATAAGLSFAVMAGALYLLHAASVMQQASSVAYLGGAASKVFLEDSFFARWDYFLFVVAFNPLFWIMGIEGAAAAWKGARAGGRRADWLPLILTVPALTPLIYRNAYDYYYPFILAPAAIVVALFHEKHRALALKAGKSLGASVLPIMLAAQCAIGAVHVWRNLPDDIAPQRTVLAAVHAVFPQPVPYIDGYGVVATFPRGGGGFMSSWGMEKYHAADQPVFADLVARTQPPLLLADSVALYGAMMPGLAIAVPELTLLPEDAAFLKDNYLPHGGMLFVAGKRLTALGSEATFEIAVAGPYRLESAVPMVIDGQNVPAGAVITLAAGGHRLGATAAAQDATLRWADARPSPDDTIGILEFFVGAR